MLRTVQLLHLYLFYFAYVTVWIFSSVFIPIEFVRHGSGCFRGVYPTHWTRIYGGGVTADKFIIFVSNCVLIIDDIIGECTVNMNILVWKTSGLSGLSLSLPPTLSHTRLLTLTLSSLQVSACLHTKASYSKTVLKILMKYLEISRVWFLY
jgi:hypothetical protein